MLSLKNFSICEEKINIRIYIQKLFDDLVQIIAHNFEKWQYFDWLALILNVKPYVKINCNRLSLFIIIFHISNVKRTNQNYNGN